MKIRKLTMPSEIIKGKSFPLNTIILTLDTGVIVTSNDFHHKRNLPLRCRCYVPWFGKWVLTETINDYTEFMWEFYRKTQKRSKKDHTNYANMMKHERKKKTGGSGASRERKMTCTDYECAKNPLHDFRRCYN